MKSRNGLVGSLLVLVVFVAIFLLLLASSESHRESADRCDQAAKKLDAYTHDYTMGICDITIRKTDGSFQTVYFEDEEVREILNK